MYTPAQRLMRSRTDKMIAGVAGGLAHYLGIDATIVRLGFVALALTGAGLLLYPLLWLIMPLEGTTGPAPRQAVDELRQQAVRMGDEIREVFVSPGSTPRRPRFNPMTGEPIDSEGEIPINNVNPDANPDDVQKRRNQLLGLILLGIGTFILLTAIPGIGAVVGRFLVPGLLIAAGIYVLRRREV
jgi:phage shock protein C